MPNEFARNIQDASINPAAFALGTASASVTSAAIDLGADVFKTANLELELSIPAHTTAIIPDASTVQSILETSTTSNFAAIVGTYSETATGAGAAGIPLTITRFRLPSNCPRYVRFKVTRGAGGLTAAGLNGTGTVRF